MRRRIALSGSAGTGKTSLCETLSRHLALPLVSEGMRDRLEAGLDLHALTHLELRSLVQELFDEMLSALRSHEESNRGCIVDRAPLDYAAFWLYYGFGADEAATRAFFAASERASRHLDLVIVLPWGVLPLAADGIRSPNPWRQLHFQAVLEGLAMRGFGGTRYAFLPKEALDPETRQAWVLEQFED